MKIRNIGLSTGLIFSAIALVVGFSLISMAENMEFISGKGGGGLALLMQWIMTGLSLSCSWWIQCSGSNYRLAFFKSLQLT
ncbi:MAG: hypothetical protein COA74_06420 [Gammaproteobacteria bacterium]|nr:MAG: hypothetical protein COA74_06420 [Gammaproteobacteria bacterium]